VRFDISSPGRLVGKIRLPGDRALTLSSLALGMLTGRTVTLSNPSPSPDIGILERFLRDQGAELSDSPGAIVMKGCPFEGVVIVPRDLPDEALFAVVCAALFTAREVRIERRESPENDTSTATLSVLRALGFTGDARAAGNGDVLLEGAEFSPPEAFPAGSLGEFEAAAAAAMASRREVVIAFHGPSVSPALGLVTALGAHIADAGRADGHDAELARRMARATGAKAREERRFSWNFTDCEIRIPGDLNIAAAVAAAASAIPKSDITLRDVLWEPGRRGFFEALRRMKGNVEWNPRQGYPFDAADVRVGWSALEGVHLTSAQAEFMGPEAMILGVLASAASGETILRRAASNREDNRVEFARLAAGLESLGATVGEYPDGIIVKGSSELIGNLVDSGGSPDVALALAVAGALASGTTSVFGYDGDAYPAGEFRRIIGALSAGG